MPRSKPATITAVTSTTCHRLIQSKNPTARGYNKKLSAPLWGAYGVPTPQGAGSDTTKDPGQTPTLPTQMAERAIANFAE